MGSREELERLKNLIDKQAKLYSNRGFADCRLFLNLDDRTVEQWLDLIETAETPIEIDPRDFK